MTFTEFASSLQLDFVTGIVLILTGLLIGLNKAGLRGVSIIIIPFLAQVFGGRASAGILLPILIVGDVFAVIWYRNSVDWRRLIGLIPWTIVGVIMGTVFGGSVSDEIFRITLGILLLICLILMTILEFRGTIETPRTWYYSAIVGAIAGFATMVGNAAGPIMALYLLMMNLPKERYIGTGAVFFLVINVFKVPFHVLAWKTITVQTIILDGLVAPLVILSFFLGLKIVRIIPEKPFRWFIIVTTLAGVVKLFF